PPRRLGPSPSMLAARGLAAMILLVATAAASVVYGSGALDEDPVVFADVPASAGLLVGEIGVAHRGVQIGTVAGIDSGVEISRVTMRIDADEIDRVPASALVRIVPRTLFGDVYIQLIPDPGAPTSIPGTSASLEAGDRLAVDSSEGAIQLGEVYRKVTDLLHRLEPAELQTALTAISTALLGRGEDIGATIDRLSSTTALLEPHVDAAISRLPEIRQVTEAFDAATPDVIATLDAATSLSQMALDRSGGVEALLTSAAVLASSADDIASENRAHTVAVIRRGAPALDTVAGNASGLATALDRFAPFGAAGTRIFASGRFDITAVPDFSEPLPYTAADCPQYPGLDGPNCALAEVQEAAGAPGPLNPASTMLLAPILRGTEVAIR
ncbi:MAG: MCE family protein, partial [Rhodococcus sp. (in: high G+C Gram-positive bacteria)]